MDFPKEPHPPKARHRWCDPNNTEIEPNKKAVQNDENVANAHCENEFCLKLGKVKKTYCSMLCSIICREEIRNNYHHLMSDGDILKFLNPAIVSKRKYLKL